MDYSLMTISELDRIASNSDCELVKALNAKMQELIDEIGSISTWEEAGDETDVAEQIEYVKKAAGWANNYQGPRT